MPYRVLVLSVDFHWHHAAVMVTFLQWDVSLFSPWFVGEKSSFLLIDFQVSHDNRMTPPHFWLINPKFRGWNPHIPPCLLAKSPRATVKTQGFPWIFHGKVRSKPPRHRAGLALGDLERWSPERLGTCQDGDDPSDWWMLSIVNRC